MPCGGIYPIEESIVSEQPHEALQCWVCRGTGCELWVEEWDTVLHRKCFPVFINSEEGATIMDHGHAIILPEKEV